LNVGGCRLELVGMMTIDGISTFDIEIPMISQDDSGIQRLRVAKYFEIQDPKL